MLLLGLHCAASEMFLISTLLVFERVQDDILPCLTARRPMLAQALFFLLASQLSYISQIAMLHSGYCKVQYDSAQDNIRTILPMNTSY